MCGRCALEDKRASSYRTFLENIKNGSRDVYKSQIWKELKDSVIKSNPFCVSCGDKERLHIDHIYGWKNGKTSEERLELFRDKKNLQPLCVSCHAGKGNDINSLEIVRRFEQLLLGKDPQAMSIVLAEMARRGQREIPCYKSS